jgi:hypothetical protein
MLRARHWPVPVPRIGQDFSWLKPALLEQLDNPYGEIPTSKFSKICLIRAETHWRLHFRWDGVRVVGITPTGRATVMALHMSRPLALVIRGGGSATARSAVAQGLYVFNAGQTARRALRFGLCQSVARSGQKSLAQPRVCMCLAPGMLCPEGAVGRSPGLKPVSTLGCVLKPLRGGPLGHLADAKHIPGFTLG